MASSLFDIAPPSANGNSFASATPAVSGYTGFKRFTQPTDLNGSSLGGLTPAQVVNMGASSSGGPSALDYLSPALKIGTKLISNGDASSAVDYLGNGAKSLTNAIDEFGANNLGIGTLAGDEAGLTGGVSGAGLSSYLGPLAAVGVPLVQGDYEGAGLAATGAAIGSVVPGVGTALGAMIGSIASSLLKRPPPVKGAASFTGLNPDGTLSNGYSVSMQGADKSGDQATTASAADTLNKISKGLGLSWQIPTSGYQEDPDLAAANGKWNPQTFGIEAAQNTNKNSIPLTPQQQIFTMLKQGAGGMGALKGAQDKSGKYQWAMDYGGTLKAPQPVLDAIKNSSATDLQGLLQDLSPYVNGGSPSTTTPASTTTPQSTQPNIRAFLSRNIGG